MEKMALKGGYLMSSDSEDFISLKSLANELRVDRSNLLKYVKGRTSIGPRKRRTSDSKNQPAIVFTPAEAESIRRQRVRDGYGTTSVVPTADNGEFYIIQLVPELDPKRLKLGFAENSDNRLSQHRTAAPTARVLKAWPCKRSWETTVMDALTVDHCRLILNEVFECDSIEELLSIGDTLFSHLPDPNESPRLSENSPIAV